MPRKKVDLPSLARTFTESAVKTLVGIMQQPKAPHASRVQAAQVLLDRGWGKAPQEVKASGDYSLTIITGVHQPKKDDDADD